MRKDNSKWYLLVIMCLLAIIIAGGLKDFNDSRSMAKEAVYFQVITLLNQAEAIAWGNAYEDLDAPIPMNWDLHIFREVDYNIMGVTWVEGEPYPEGDNTLKAGTYILHLQRFPSTPGSTGYWERSDN